MTYEGEQAQFWNDRKQIVALFSNMSEGVLYGQIITDDTGTPIDFVFLDINDAYERIQAVKREKVLGRRATELNPGIKDESLDWIRICGRVALTGEPITLEQHSYALNKWYHSNIFSPQKGYFVAIIEDITDRKRTENERETTIAFLHLVNESSSTKDLVHAATAFFQIRSGAEAVGIRLKEGDDYPYYETKGFPQEFVLLESHLCVRDVDKHPLRDNCGYPILECMCGNVIRGRFDPSKPFFTRKGSFWTNNTTELLATTTDEDRQARTRNRCNGEGYESVAVILLRSGEECIGLLQLNDRRIGMFSIEIIELWERLAGYLAVALAKFRSEEALKESEETLGAFFDASPGILTIEDEEFRYIRTDGLSPTLFGLDRQSIIGRSAKELAPGLNEKVGAMKKRVIERGEPILNVEVQGPSPNRPGEIDYWRASYFPVPLPGGKHGIGVMGVDITEGKKAEEALRESEERFRTLADNIPQLVWMADATGWIFWYNQRWYDYTGTTPEKMEGWGWQSVHNPEVLPKVLDQWKGSIITGQPFDMVFPLRGADGVFRPFLTRVQPVKDEDGKIVRWFGTNTDITKEVEAQRNLERSNEELRQFAYVASHDLQEPLRMVTAYLSLLEKKYLDQLDGQAKQYMDFAIEGGLRAKDLIRDLLEFSRVDSQAKQFQPIDMEQVLEQVLTSLKIQIQDEHAIVKHDELPTVLADDVQMGQLMQNLVSNAIKFHGEERPIAHIACEDKNDRWLFYVRDNGIGIDPAYKDKIFVLFQRLHNRQQYEGTGIGLAISKKIVERHGGKIWFESVVGEGTTFYFTIPKGSSR